MKRALVLPLALALVLALSSWVVGVRSDALGGPNGVYYNSGDFVVNVPGNGNQPRYTFYLNGSADPTYYYIRFLQMFEVDPVTLQQVPQSMLSLSSLDYDWSQSEETSTGFNFNITAAGTKGSKTHFNTLTIANHLLLPNTTDFWNVTDYHALKFDVILDGYNWASNNSNLVFLLSFAASSSFNPNGTSNSSVLQPVAANSVTVNAGFFNTTPNATCGGATVPVSLIASNTTGENGIWLMYGHFGECELVHDPTIGIEGNYNNGTNGNGNDNGPTYSTKEFEINVPGNGNQPRYTFWKSGSNDTYYSLRFLKLFEIDGNQNQVPSSVISLSSLDFDWTSGATTSSGDFTFNITAGWNKGQSARFKSLTFVNHLSNDTTSSAVKFDVVLDSYQWVNPSNTTSLVFLFSFYSSDSLSGSASSSTSGPLDSGSNMVKTGRGFFSVTPTASCGSATVNASLNGDNNTTTSNGGIWLIYSHFDNDCVLVHDPEMGIAKSHLWFWIVAGVGGAIVLLVVAMAVALALRKRRRHGYQTV